MFCRTVGCDSGIGKLPQLLYLAKQRTNISKRLGQIICNTILSQERGREAAFDRSQLVLYLAQLQLCALKQLTGRGYFLEIDRNTSHIITPDTNGQDSTAAAASSSSSLCACIMVLCKSAMLVPR